MRTDEKELPMPKILVAAIAVILSACVTLTPAMKKISISEDRNAVARCQQLGRVHGDFDVDNVKGNEQAMVKKTYELGGDTLLVINDAGNRGEAYKCGTPEMEPTPVP
jgi:starvation-inducible outer membrane lipoprotein